MHDPLDAPEVRLWSAGFSARPGLLETVAHWVGFTQIMVAVRFFWPTFVEEQGCVLLPWEFSAETFQAWWEELSGDCKNIENAVNHLHLWDVFSSDEIPESQLVELGQVLAGSWAAALKEQHESREFDVRFTNEKDDYGPTVSIVSL